jgi:23S rRNA (cytosine1962-C5)-methyltransferase
MKTVRVRKTKRVLSGYLWVFSNEIEGKLKGFTPGELVELTDRRGNFLAIGYINPRSLIAVRVLSRKKTEIDHNFFKSRIKEALLYRQKIYNGLESYRVVFSESDLLPGLIVDRYGDVVVTQILTAGMEGFKDTIVDIIKELLNPSCIIMKNDSPFRQMEGLETEKAIVDGSLEKLPIIREAELQFEVDPLEGQKTGFFLDQRENRQTFASLIDGGEGLDLFCYTGAWGMHIAQRGARVTCVDSSKSALYMAEKNAILNSLTDKMEFVCADVFEYLTELRSTRKKYDFIVLDPPAFVKSRSTLSKAIKGYRSINANAMALLKKGGFMATSSCSHHLSEEDFLDVIRYAAQVINRYVRVIELRSQAKDHPVLLSMPETRYLKCAILQVF